ALSFTGRRDEIEHARRHVRRGLELDAILRIERGEIVEENFLARDVRMFEVDRFDFDQREVTLALFRRTHLTGDGVARAEIKSANLRRRNVNVVGTRQVVVLRRAKESESVRQALKHPLGKNQS